MMPGQKTLPSDDWKDQNKQLVPSTSSNSVARRPSQRHGMPWTDRQSKLQIDNNAEPPPTFTAAPKKISIKHVRDNKHQKYIQRMDNGIDPVVLLTDRMESWHSAIKSLVSLFKKLVVVENKTAKNLVNASKEIVLPFPKSNGQFLETGAGGIQDVWGSLRDYTLQHGILHHESAGYIEKAVIPALRAIKADIRTMIISVQKDKNLKTTLIFESRIQVDRLISRLDKVIEHVYRAPLQAEQYTDPFLINLGIVHAVRELCDHENRLHDNIFSLQKETGMFEQKIIENIRYVLLKLQEYKMKHKMEAPEYIDQVIESFDYVKPSMEWNEFVRRNQYNLIMENSAYKTENMVEYPNQDSKFVRAIKIGPLEQRTGTIKRWTEGVYLLTPAGFLHGYKTPKHFQQNPLRPSYSIFVPHISVEYEDDDDVFELRGSDRRSSMGLGTHYVFRANNPREAQEWSEALLRINDQFRPMPLLEAAPAGFSSNKTSAPVHRDLPPLPESTLPLAGQSDRKKEKMRAIEGPGRRGLGTVNEDHDEEGHNSKPLPHKSTVPGGSQFIGEQQYQHQLADPATPVTPAQALNGQKFDKRPAQEQKDLPMMQGNEVQNSSFHNDPNLEDDQSIHSKTEGEEQHSSRMEKNPLQGDHFSPIHHASSQKQGSSLAF
ncbi:uncharacterized protein B0P05DRAFT_473073 [Gilbertella persicaria]|uniref:uncharacterized protein n=1 Tax=Gilbertella persicaria TaxID=101096 RepID=UPI002220EAC3|nr:uncharacterized protein B0P05DRAFT_473073 [Gilbertella persicaria]KAI8074254.1 hypothetical protein B0P05DRAFT_473073 [Gilbertella persicaria]